MLPDEAARILVTVASICVILLTFLAGAAIIAVIRAALEVRALARSLRREVLLLAERRRRIVYWFRATGRWIRLMAREEKRERERL